MPRFGHICERCGYPIRATVADPVISAPSLGRGFFHEQCAAKQWCGNDDTNPPEVDDIDEIADCALALLEVR
jgi:hypothetical protein